jgi:hypothetical protein
MRGKLGWVANILAGIGIRYLGGELKSVAAFSR